MTKKQFINGATVTMLGVIMAGVLLHFAKKFSATEKVAKMATAGFVS